MAADRKPRVPRLCEPCGMLPTRLLFLEAGDPVLWTEPEGIPYYPTWPIRLQGLFRDGFRASSDRGDRILRQDADAEFLRSVITRNGGVAGGNAEARQYRNTTTVAPAQHSTRGQQWL